MSVQFTVLQLLNADCGSLVEIALTGTSTPIEAEHQWLWIEAGGVLSLQVIDSGTSSERVFDRAVLTLEDSQGELCWSSGKHEALTIDASLTLRPRFQHLVHQHLN